MPTILDRTKLNTRLMLMAGILSFLLLGSGIVGIYAMSEGKSALETTYRDRLVPSQQIAQINLLMSQNMVLLFRATSTPDRSTVAQYIGMVKENIREITWTWNAYLETQLTPDEVQIANEFASKRAYFAYEGLLEPIQLLEAGNLDAAKKHLSTITSTHFDDAILPAQNLLKLHNNIAQNTLSTLQSQYRTILALSVAGIAASMLLGLWLAWLISRSISRSVTQIRDVIDIIENTDDLALRIPVQGEDEIAELARAFNRMLSRQQASLQKIVTQEQDIAARRQLEAELRRSNQELEQFAYVASHDLQEPLRMVSSYTQLLSRRYKGKLDENADEFIHFATDGAQRMQMLINDLLRYSRIGTRGAPFSQLDMGKTLDDALQNLRIAIEESHAVITHDALPVVTADAVQMMQLLQNLIGNALKFRNPGATADTPPKIHVGAQRIEAGWLFSVGDNGIGIAPEYFERIFQIFQRLHEKSAYPGTGIGLALCKKIVERHGGQIRVDSRTGEGSTFSFNIPDIAPDTPPENTSDRKESTDEYA